MIEKACLATVFINTGWRTGSGFFIDKTCYVVTNRHVIQAGEGELKEEKNKLEKIAKDIKHKEGLLSDLKKFCQQMDFSYNINKICLQIEAKELELKAMNEQYEKMATLVDKKESGTFDIKVKAYRKKEIMRGNEIETVNEIIDVFF